MKRTSLIVAAAAFTLIAGGASAQTTGVGVTGTIAIAPEQRTVIKRYVVERNVAPATIRERVVVGSALPAEVELQTAPADWGPAISQYRYVYYDNNVVLVEPSTRQVIQIID
jgi:hypothetical protein